MAPNGGGARRAAWDTGSTPNDPGAQGQKSGSDQELERAMAEKGSEGLCQHGTKSEERY